MNYFKTISIILLLLIIVLTVPVMAKEYEISNYDIKLRLEENGDYLIKEKITYNFKEGTFSWAFRNIKGKGFNNLEFISIKGLNTDLTDYNVEQGDKLNVKWHFPDTGGQKTFVIIYKATGGLITRGEKNIIDWLAVGREWQVPLNNINVQIILPQVVENTNISPKENITYQSDEEIRFYKKHLDPGERYRLTIEFPKLIETDKSPERESNSNSQGVGRFLIIGLIAGLITTFFDIFRRRKRKPAQSEIDYSKLSLAKQAVIYSKGTQNRSGVAAQLFNLAKKGNIKLISKIKKGFLGSKKSEIAVNILSEDNLNPVDEKIIDKLKEHKNLKKFASDSKLFNQVDKIIKKELKELKIISVKAWERRKSILFSSLLLFLPGILALIYGGIKNLPLIMGIGPFLIILGIGRLIKGGLTPVLSGEGVYLKNKIEEKLDNKKDRLEELIKEKEANKAINFFFENLEYIILHNDFNSSTLKKYKKLFKNAEEINIPEWLEFDLSNIDETLEALEIVEIIDYMMVSMLVIASNTGAVAGSTGSSGGAAGGGGGAAG